MDIKKLITLLCFVGVLAWGGMKLKKGFLQLMDASTRTREESVASLPQNLSRNGFAQYLRAPKNVTNEITQSGISKECESYVSAVEGVDVIFFKDLTFHTTYQQLTSPSSSCALTDDLVASTEREYLKNCFLINPTKTDVISDNCVRAFLMFRSALTNMLVKNKKISDVESLGKLTDVLYAEVFPTTLQPDAHLNLRRIGQVADRMVDLNPNFKAARKVQFYVLTQEVLSQIPGKTLKEQEEIWSKMQDALEGYQKRNNLEDGGADFKIFVQTHGFDPSLTSKVAGDMMAANPNDPKAVYLSAFAHWKNGDHEEAFKALGKAAEMAPANEGFQKALHALSMPGAGDGPFCSG